MFCVSLDTSNEMDNKVVKTLGNARIGMLNVPGSVCVVLTLCKKLGDGFAVVV